MANLIHAEFYVYGDAKSVDSLDAEIPSLYESASLQRYAAVEAEALLEALDVKGTLDGTVLAVRREKSHKQGWGILFDTEMRWDYIPMKDAMERLVAQRPGLKLAFRATDDFCDVSDPDGVYFKRSGRAAQPYGLTGNIGGELVDITFRSEDDLLDFAREDLGFDVRGIDELAIALEYAGIELSVPRSM